MSKEREENIAMTNSILNGKRILAVDDETDVLAVLEEEILEAAPKCLVDKATSYKEATEKMISWTYDVVILDIMGVRGFDLLELAVGRNFSVAMLTAHALTPDALKRSIELKARAFLPKEKLGEVVPFLEAMLKYEYLPGWKHLFEKLRGFFTGHWGQNWQKIDEEFWKDFENKTAQIKW
jgi:CheY-like chemotaxis protein